MHPLRLDFPVHTLDGQQLLAADTVLSEEILERMIAGANNASRQSLPLLKHGSVARDVDEFMRQAPYDEIFAEQETSAAVKKLMKEVLLHPAALESLDYFKTHDFYTYRHILLVFAVSTRLAHDLVADYQDLILEAMAGPTHDFGKICVPLDILRKTDPLTRVERLMLEHHATAGYVLLIHYYRDSQGLGARVARDHHEKKDGSGYPAGIMQIDRMVEIVAVSDIYDALISPRPYRPSPYDNRTALEEITELATQGKLSPEIVQVLVASNRSSKPHFRECVVSEEKRGTPPVDNLYGVIAAEDPDPEDFND